MRIAGAILRAVLILPTVEESHETLCNFVDHCFNQPFFARNQR
jgi:hypothetical protein